ncbi:Transmembrane osmosensor [Vanrija albida]|uniref:Transmembrane osmosensor n=1 Tax=Vanrija albida TaxID=181172 RepID=A0ABR3Q5Z0_9TREE
MFDNGLDVGVVFRHPTLLVTFALGIPGWLVAFAAQCALQARVGKLPDDVRAGNNSTAAAAAAAFSTVSPGNLGAGVLWFAIWVQLFLIIGIFLACASDCIATYRLQISVFAAISLVFAVIGVNQHIYSKGEGAALATAAGWLILAIVDILWLLLFTSEEGSLLYHVLNGNSGLSWGGLARGRSVRTSHNEAGVYQSESAGLRHGAADRGMSSHDIPTGNGYGMGPTLGSAPNGLNGVAGGYSSAPTMDTVASKANVNTTASRDDFSVVGGSVDNVTYKHRAKANYAYTASPDDPNEVSFAKGDILDVVDTTGKWYQVRTPSGQVGIAPSNYLSLL